MGREIWREKLVAARRCGMQTYDRVCRVRGAVLSQVWYAHLSSGGRRIRAGVEGAAHPRSSPRRRPARGGDGAEQMTERLKQVIQSIAEASSGAAGAAFAGAEPPSQVGAPAGVSVLLLCFESAANPGVHALSMYCRCLATDFLGSV